MVCYVDIYQNEIIQVVKAKNWVLNYPQRAYFHNFEVGNLKNGCFWKQNNFLSSKVWCFTISVLKIYQEYSQKTEKAKSHNFPKIHNGSLIMQKKPYNFKILKNFLKVPEICQEYEQHPIQYFFKKYRMKYN